MRNFILAIGLVAISAASSYAAKEVTICFSQGQCDDKYSFAVLGNDVNLCGGKCKGRNIEEMYRDGWRLVQVVSGLQSSYGMVFEREGKADKERDKEKEKVNPKKTKKK